MRKTSGTQKGICPRCGRNKSDHYPLVADHDFLEREQWLEAQAKLDALFLEQHLENLGDGLTQEYQ